MKSRFVAHHRRLKTRHRRLDISARAAIRTRVASRRRRRDAASVDE
jgi:hypothetical protein